MTRFPGKKTEIMRVGRRDSYSRSDEVTVRHGVAGTIRDSGVADSLAVSYCTYRTRTGRAQ